MDDGKQQSKVVVCYVHRGWVCAIWVFCAQLPSNDAGTPRKMNLPGVPVWKDLSTGRKGVLSLDPRAVYKQYVHLPGTPVDLLSRKTAADTLKDAANAMRILRSGTYKNTQQLELPLGSFIYVINNLSIKHFHEQ